MLPMLQYGSPVHVFHGFTSISISVIKLIANEITDFGQPERAVSSKCSAYHDSDGFTSTQAVSSLEAEVTDTISLRVKSGFRLADQNQKDGTGKEVGP